MNEAAETVREFTVPAELAGLRLDQALAALVPELSRARLQKLIRAGEVQLGGAPCETRQKVRGGEFIHLHVRPQPPDRPLEPDALRLDVVFEDEDILVLNKPAGLVVHPAAGNWRGTLANGLVHHDAAQAALPRAGIVHRLDKDTTGLMVVARNEIAQTHLVRQLQARSVSREYDAVVLGVPIAGGEIDAPLGRHPRDRLRQAVQREGAGKEARTHYRVHERFRGHAWLRCRLETGRTHQIRVHMSHIRHPIVGDSLYAGRLRIPAGLGEDARQRLREFPRQALHAWRLGLVHPRSGEPMHWCAAPPDDMQGLIETLRADADQATDAD